MANQPEPNEMPKSAAVNHADSPFDPHPAAATLDLVHLSRQSLGDRALEVELLSLFDRQASQFAARLVEPGQPKDAQSRADLAHTLKGSARAVGAFAIGDAAGAYEAALRGGAGDPPALCENLVREIARAHAMIAAMLGDERGVRTDREENI
jgi:HPt (histidine-containing phosphotransfer) domain-containing protein